MRHLIELKDIHYDEDIYVLGSGPTLNFIHPSFFNGKTVIGVNQIYKYCKCQYIVRKESKFLKESLESGATVVMSKYNSGNFSNELNPSTDPNVIIFGHLNNQHMEIDTSVVGRDVLAVSFSTITSAIHLAAYMGAKNIIIVGHDCGLLDDKMTMDNYYDSIQDTPWQDWSQYKTWLKVIESQTIKLKKSLIEIYDCNIVSLNPFINFNLEGHVYR